VKHVLEFITRSRWTKQIRLVNAALVYGILNFLCKKAAYKYHQVRGVLNSYGFNLLVRRIKNSLKQRIVKKKNKMWKFSLFCMILSALVGVIFGESKTQLVAENIDELNDVANFFATASFSKLDEMTERVEKFGAKSKMFAKFEKLIDKPSQLFDIVLPPENASIEKLSMIKVVLFNEFAKTVNVPLDDILFTMQMVRKQMLEAKDLMEGNSTVASWYNSKSSEETSAEKKDTDSSDCTEELALLGMKSHRKVTQLDKMEMLEQFSDPKEITFEKLPLFYVTRLNEVAKSEDVTLDDMLGLLRFVVSVKEILKVEGAIKPPENLLQFLKAVKENSCPEFLASFRTSNTIQKQPAVSAPTEVQEFLLKTDVELGDYIMPYVLFALRNWCETPDEVIMKTIRVFGLVVVSSFY